MSYNEICEYLEQCGVCKVCRLRYLKIRDITSFELKSSIDKLSTNVGSDESPSKKQKTENCPTCLGLFSDQFQNELVNKVLSFNLDQYDCPEIGTAFSFPMIFHIRQLSMWFAIIKKFGEVIDNEKTPDFPVKEAAKIILNPIICQKLNKSFNTEGLLISITLDHPDEEQDVGKLSEVDQSVFGKKHKRKKFRITRNYIEKVFLAHNVPIDEFEKHFAVPPKASESSLILKDVLIAGPCVFLAGRYCKLSRQLSHSPWILQNKRMMEDSIQEIIIRSVAPKFGVKEDEIIFSSSGREDVDVRCLGGGRPFVLEIPNSKIISLSKAVARDIELDIDKSLKVSIRNLQIVSRDDLVHIKTGEELKKKNYRALCALEQPATAEVLEKLNCPHEFSIEQITPIRVLHRRPLHNRPRMIYSMKAWVDKDNPKYLIVDLVTQAGTYIKELVHGDFGRTTPSFASIIGQPIDIIALDVMGVDLDWPDYRDNREIE